MVFFKIKTAITMRFTKQIWWRKHNWNKFILEHFVYEMYAKCSAKCSNRPKGAWFYGIIILRTHARSAMSAFYDAKCSNCRKHRGYILLTFCLHFASQNAQQNVSKMYPQIQPPWKCIKLLIVLIFFLKFICYDKFIT